MEATKRDYIQEAREALDQNRSPGLITIKQILEDVLRFRSMSLDILEAFEGKFGPEPKGVGFIAFEIEDSEKLIPEDDGQDFLSRINRRGWREEDIEIGHNLITAWWKLKHGLDVAAPEEFKIQVRELFRECNFPDSIRPENLQR